MRHKWILQWGFSLNEWSLGFTAKWYRFGARGIAMEVLPLRLGVGRVLRNENHTGWIERVA